VFLYEARRECVQKNMSLSYNVSRKKKKLFLKEMSLLGAVDVPQSILYSESAFYYNV